MTTGELRVRSRRFGDLAVPADKVLEFADGLVGLPRCRRFLIMDHQPGSPFKWMVCLDDPELGFAVVNPSEFVPDYTVYLDGAAAELAIGEGDEVAILAIVTIPPEPTKMTIDLLAPVVVNLRTRRAKQILMEESPYAAACPLVSLMPASG